MNDLSESLPVEPGTMIGSKYRVERLLAIGGMGAVVVAQHEVLAQRVAIKFMLPELAENREAAQRFLQEARASARLQSDYVARVTDVDLLDDGTPYMVMEYLEGKPLDEVIESGPQHTLTGAVDVALEALAGLTAAHLAGIVHRDLKPSNLFMTKVGGDRMRVKILDFGISKVLEEDSGIRAGVVTTAHSVLGSPRYMSPEQIADTKSVDERTDIWSLGVILYELLTHQPVFDGENVNAILAKILTEEIPPVTKARPDTPKGLAFVIWKCMAKERSERFRSTKEVMRALAPYASKRIRSTMFVVDDENMDGELELASTVAVDPDQYLGGTAVASEPMPSTVPLPDVGEKVDDEVSVVAGGAPAPAQTQAEMTVDRSVAQPTWQTSEPQTGKGRALAVVGVVGVVALAAAASAFMLGGSDAGESSATETPSTTAAVTAKPAVSEVAPEPDLQPEPSATATESSATATESLETAPEPSAIPTQSAAPSAAPARSARAVPVATRTTPQAKPPPKPPSGHDAASRPLRRAEGAGSS